MSKKFCPSAPAGKRFHRWIILSRKPAADGDGETIRDRCENCGKEREYDQIGASVFGVQS